MNLLMLTKFYPFGTGEAFIENEIAVLSEYYDKILIIACEVSNGDYCARPLPSNVTACRVPCGSRRKDTLRGMIQPFSGNTELADEMRYARGILAKIFLRYFEEKSRRIVNYILQTDLIEESCIEPFVLYSYWFFTTARVGTLIRGRYEPRYMFTRAHRYDLYEDKNKTGYLPYRLLFLKSYHSVFPCSEDGTDYLRRKYGDDAQNVHTSFLGTLDRGLGRASTDGVFRIVSCSRLEHVKRVSRIVDALCLLDREDIAIEWTHIGSGTDFEAVRKKAESGLRRIKFKFLGDMKNADVMKLYQTSPFDLFLNVSDSEGLPVSIMEGISFGIPAVATDVGGTSEIVKDGVTGRLISSDFTNKQLAAVIRNFAVNGDMSVSRESCRKFWEEHFQAIPNYRKLCEFVREQYESGSQVKK